MVLELPEDHPANLAVAESVAKAAAFYAEVEQYHRDVNAEFNNPERTVDWTEWCHQMAAWSEAVSR